MVNKASVGIPPRIKEDVLNNNARSLRLFLQNIKERVDYLTSQLTGLTELTTATQDSGDTTPASLVDADTLDGFDSTAFARKAANETITGTWTHTGSLTANQFIETSDRRLKKNIEPLKECLEIIKDLQGVSYIRKQNDEHEIGFIAQDVKEVLPELVSEQGEYLGINYSRLVAILVEALKEQDKKIESLATIIRKLERIN